VVSGPQAREREGDDNKVRWKIYRRFQGSDRSRSRLEERPTLRNRGDRREPIGGKQLRSGCQEKSRGAPRIWIQREEGRLARTGYYKKDLIGRRCEEKDLKSISDG